MVGSQGYVGHIKVFVVGCEGYSFDCFVCVCGVCGCECEVVVVVRVEVLVGDVDSSVCLLLLVFYEDEVSEFEY